MKNGWQTRTLGEALRRSNWRNAETSVTTLVADGMPVSHRRMAARARRRRRRADISLTEAASRTSPTVTTCSAIISLACDHRASSRSAPSDGDQSAAAISSSTSGLDARVPVLLPAQHSIEHARRIWHEGDDRQRRSGEAHRADFQIPFRRSPSSSGSSASSTKRSRASPPPRPTPRRTSRTPARSSRATSKSVFTERGEGWVEKPLGDVCDDHRRIGVTISHEQDRATMASPFITVDNIVGDRRLTSWTRRRSTRALRRSRLTRSRLTRRRPAHA